MLTAETRLAEGLRCLSRAGKSGPLRGGLGLLLGFRFGGPRRGGVVEDMFHSRAALVSRALSRGAADALIRAARDALVVAVNGALLAALGALHAIIEARNGTSNVTSV